MNFQIEPSCQIDHDTLNKIYNEYFGDNTDKVFVEIGAADGRSYSNTSCLLRAGWKGHLVEANPDSYRQMEYNLGYLPNANLYNFAISPSGGKVTFYQNGFNSSLGLTDLTRHIGCNETQATTVDSQTLNQFFNEHFMHSPHLTDPSGGIWIEKIDLLCIDVEDMEADILETFHINQWKPTMCIVETHEHHEIPHWRHNAERINNYFAQNNYTKIHSDTINSIYVENQYVK